MELKVDDFVKNIKRPYLTVLGVFVVAVSLFFDAIMFFYAKLYDKLLCIYWCLWPLQL